MLREAHHVYYKGDFLTDNAQQGHTASVTSTQVRNDFYFPFFPP